jgi:BASS family bile acid:Na+ symporter
MLPSLPESGGTWSVAFWDGSSAIASVFVGLAVQDLAALLKPLVGPSVFILFAATVLRLDLEQIFARLRAPLRPLLIVAGVMVLAPLIMAGALALLGPPDYLRAPLVLLMSSPPLISVPAFSILVGLDGPLALVVMVTGSLLQPLLQPPVALLLVGIHLDIGPGALMLRLTVFIGGAFALAGVIRWWLGAERVRAQGPAIGGVAVLMLVIFGIGVMDGLLAQLFADPTHVLTIFAGIVAANYGMQAVGALLFWALAPAWRLSGREGLTAALIMGTRNIATLLATLGVAAGPDLYIALACNQFPMYLIPSIMGPVYALLLRLRS